MKLAQTAPAFLALVILAALGSSHAQPSEEQENLRGLTPADLCPPTSYVYVDDKEDEDTAAQLDEALDRYATLYDIPYGDPKTCTVLQTFMVDAFKSSGKYVYSVKLMLEVRKPVTVNVPLPTAPADAQKAAKSTAPGADRPLKINYLTVWDDQGFGLLSDVNSIPGASIEQVREYYEAFALAWKATHKK